ncbi:MAG: S-adenosylmethionine:tRNA ribosyltransferase-isomerase [Flavobacteriales bacterium]|nr:S-adenosylmethionine:tRNA ribosyltransferase-isomerase [Flavobacteriales bacterium]
MNSNPRDIAIADYNYFLPEDRVAQFPLPVRSDSKLLLFKSGSISDQFFYDLPDLLDRNDSLFMNKTRVIPARLRFRKSTGASIEIFCLEPIGLDHQQAMTATDTCTWKCLVGGAKKWKGFEILNCEIPGSATLFAEMVRREDDAFVIRFFWKPETISFSSILHEAGKIPLPPYFHRDPEESDLNRYQTVFAEKEGSVAAPTAGLHFTPEVLDKLALKGVDLNTLTLHVGAGTFKPVSVSNIGDHHMHGEVFSISVDALQKLMEHVGRRRIIAVGTTSMRTLESLYWLGLKISKNLIESGQQPSLGQWESYDMEANLSLQESLDSILQWCQVHHMNEFSANTTIMIAPGFKFRICGGLLTNFHMPQSTLLVLVSAFTGEDWKKIYNHALSGNYRFLSYGDSSLLLP